MKILYKLASRSRPEKFFKCLSNIGAKAKRSDYIILASLDINDRSMFTESEINRLDLEPNLVYVFGKSKNKIDAINRDIERIKEWDILVNTSDDMLFIEEGFDLHIIGDFENDFDKVLHYNDGYQRDNCMTLSIMGRPYYNRFGYVYHPSYESLWSDCEATDVARALGKHKYMGDEKILFRHYHPSLGLTTYDEQYLKTEAMGVRNKDEQNYLERKKNKFP